MLSVSVVSAGLGPVVLPGRTVPGEYLTLSFRVTNHDRKPLDYTSWSQRKDGITLKDKHNNHYNRVSLADPPVVGLSIDPGETIEDMLVFEPPVASYTFWDLDLPSRRETPFLFRVPAGFAQGPVEAPVARVVPPPPPPRPSSRPLPSRSPAAAAGRQSRRQSGDPGADRRGLRRRGPFYRAEGEEHGVRHRQGVPSPRREQCISELAETYKVTVQDVRRMVQ